MRLRLAVLFGSSLWGAWACGSEADLTPPKPEAQSGAAGRGEGGSEQVGGAGGTDDPDRGGAGTGATPSGEAGEPNGEGGAAGSGGNSPEGVTFKVLTLNVPGSSSALAAQDILESGADIVGLQEVSPAEAAEICAELGEPWTFVQEDRVNTHAILSRLPILQRIGVTADARGGLGASIEVAPGRHAHVFDTHGMWTPYGPYQLGLEGMPLADVLESEEAVRMPGLRELLDLAAPYIHSDEVALLVGDFNAPSHLDYNPPVAWPTSVAPHEAGLVDSYAELHPSNPKKSACQFAIDDPGITWTPSPSSEPEGCFDRIDFIYYSQGDAQPTDSRTLEVESSDHRAVLTAFALPIPIPTVQARPQLPVAAATGVSRHALLTWVPGRDALSEQLVLGPTPNDVTVTDAGPGHHLTGLLAPNTTYLWRIDTVTPTGTAAGEVRQFTTRDSGGLASDHDRYATGDTISIEFDNADHPRDWIGLYSRSSAYGPEAPAAAWKYLNDSDSAPADAVASGTITLAAPQTAGRYALRFFDADGYDVEDEVTIVVD